MEQNSTRGRMSEEQKLDSELLRALESIDRWKQTLVDSQSLILGRHNLEKPKLDPELLCSGGKSELTKSAGKDQQILASYSVIV